MGWRLLTYQLVAESPRHRAAVLRELHRAGAVSLQQGLWAMPDGKVFDEALDRVVALIEGGDGNADVFDVTPREATSARLEAAFTAEREAEWAELVTECVNFDAEIAGQIATEKFTLAELNEGEQTLDRLKRWYHELRHRDLFGAPTAPIAERRLKACEEAFEDFAERVLRAQEP